MTQQNQQIQHNDSELQDQKKFVDSEYTDDNWFNVQEDGEVNENAPEDNQIQEQLEQDPNLQVDPNQQQLTEQPVLTEAQRAMQQMNQYQPQVDPNLNQQVQGYQQQINPRAIPQQPMGQYGFPQQVNPYLLAQQQMAQQGYNPYASMQYPYAYGQPQMPMQPAPQQTARQLNLPKPPENFEPYQMTDPNTESGRYFMGVLNQFGEDIANRFASQMSQQSELYNAQLEEMRLMQIQRDAEEQQFNQFLSTRPDLDIRQARQFWTWASDPNNVTVDSLYNLYQTINQQQQQIQQQNINQQQPQNVNQSQSNPLNQTLQKIRQNQQFPQTSVNVNQQPEEQDEGKRFLQGMDEHFF